MIQAKEKAAWVLDTPETAQQYTHANFTPDQTNLTRLRAKASEVGVQIYAFDDEDTGKTVFVVSRWNLTRQLDSLNSIEKWLDRVAGVSQ